MAQVPDVRKVPFSVCLGTEISCGLLGHNSSRWGVLVGEVGIFYPRHGGIGIRSHSMPSSEGVHARSPVAFVWWLL